MEKKKEKISRKTKIILALSLIFVGIFAVVILAFWGFRYLFHENPRLVIREVMLECTSGKWAGKSEQERMAKAEEFAKWIGVVPGETNLFSIDLQEIREKIHRDQPEIEYVSVYRNLPDLLYIQIQNRIPRADTGFGYFLDDSGIALRASYYGADTRKSLPKVGCSNNTLRRELTSEGKTTNPEILSALRFIRMVMTSEDPCISKITVHNVVAIRNADSKYLQCELSYRGEQNRFRVLLPSGSSEAQLRRDISNRLISVLNDAIQRPGKIRVIDLRFEGPAFSPQA